MNRDDANEVLDAARAGVPVSRRTITSALRATGDLRAHRPTCSWMHIAAMNLIADHKAGVKVNNSRLAAAYALMADFEAGTRRAKGQS